MTLAETNKNTTAEQQIPQLSDEAMEVLQFALEEAATYGRGYHIDTADLLIGLSQVGTTGERLRELGVNVERIRETKTQIGGYDDIKRLRSPAPPRAIEKWAQLPRTLRVHKIGIMVTERAFLNKKGFAEPEDILEAIISEGQGTGAKVLSRLGIDKKKLGENNSHKKS